jgi:hypothetical protein
LGVGVRQKKLGGFIPVNVYAVAAYVPLQEFKDSGAHINGQIENAIAVDKDIVIRMARHVESDVLGNALKDSLQPRLPASSIAAVDLLQVLLFIYVTLCFRSLNLLSSQNLIVAAAAASVPPFSKGSQVGSRIHHHQLKKKFQCSSSLINDSACILATHC